MIAFFPEPYPDELVYSVLARYYERSGYMTYKSVCEDLYGKTIFNPDVEYMNPLTDDAISFLTKKKCMDDIIMKHTMFPYQARFFPKEKRNLVFELLKTQTGNHREKLRRQSKNKKDRYMRFCPICIKEDRRKYGETYWHRQHQIIETKICLRHKCFLKETEVEIISNTVKGLVPAEKVVDDMAEIKYLHNEKLLLLSEYLSWMLQADVDLESDVLVGDYLDSKLEGSLYKSIRGEQRNISLLMNDFRSYCENFAFDTIEDVSQLQKIFTNYRYNTFEICLLAQFLQIPPKELIQMTLPVKRQQEVFDEKVKELHEKGMNYVEISKFLNSSYDVVKLVGRNKYLNEHKAKKNPSKGGVRKKDWESIDEEMLPLVKSAIESLKEKDGERPVKLSIAAIERKLNLPNKYIGHLPCCLSVIKENLESQKHYWAREVIWAVKDMLKSNAKVNWVYIRRKTNMRKDDLQACLPFLYKMADDDVIEVIESILDKNG